MGEERLEVLRGTLDLLVLKVLAGGKAHGYSIVRRIQERSEGVLQVEEGSLYPALHRLEHRGLVEAEWGASEAGRRARFYRLSRAGRRALAVREREWEQMSVAIGRVLRPAPEA